MSQRLQARVRTAACPFAPSAPGRRRCGPAIRALLCGLLAAALCAPRTSSAQAAGAPAPAGTAAGAAGRATPSAKPDLSGSGGSPADRPAAESATGDGKGKGGDGRGGERLGIQATTLRIADFAQLWAQRREYLRDRDERRAEDVEQRLRFAREELHIENLFSIGAALVRESQDALAAGAPLLALKRCLLAMELAPLLPDSHACRSRALLGESPANLVEAAGALKTSAALALAEPRVAHALLANVACIGLLGLLLAGYAYLVLLFVRYSKLYLHDAQHMLPVGTRSWHGVAIGGLLVVWPLLLLLGPVPAGVAALLGVAVYATTLEVVLGALVLGVMAGSPAAVGVIARNSAYGLAAADVWLVEHGEGTSAALVRLQGRLDSGKPEFAAAFVLARRAKREGALQTAEQLYRRALESPGVSSEGLGAIRNNLGNVYLLSGDHAKAVAQYQQAIEASEGLAAAHFNLSRALGLSGVDQLERTQQEQARALALDRPGIDAFTGGRSEANRRANLFVMDASLPQASLDSLESGEVVGVSSLAEDASTLLGGPLPIGAAPILPALGAAAALLLHLVAGRVKPSGRCDRCGREVCKRCDIDARPSEALCAQCVNVFVRRGNVDTTERVRKERAVAVYQRKRGWLLRGMAVLAGASHVLLGYPIRGFVFLLLTGFIAATLLLWPGVIRDPYAVRDVFSPLRLAEVAAGCVLLYGLYLRELWARLRIEGI